MTQPSSDLTRLRAAVFGGEDRPLWTIESVITLVQAHRQDSQLMDAKQDAEDRAVTAPQEQEAVRQELEDFKEAYKSMRDNVRRIDVAMHGEDGAAKSPSACDLIGPAEDLRERAEKAEAKLSALTLAIEALRGEMESEKFRFEAVYHSGDREPGSYLECVQVETVKRWAAILKEWER